MSHSMPIHCRLDRTLISLNCLSKFPTCVTHVGPRLLSDHNPLLITLSSEKRRAKCSFKFFNHWSHHPDFLPLIAHHWRYQIEGNPMFRFVKKLATVRYQLNLWTKKVFGQTREHIKCCTSSLLAIQDALTGDPLSTALIQAESNYHRQRQTFIARRKPRRDNSPDSDGSMKGMQIQPSFMHPSRLSVPKILSTTWKRMPFFFRTIRASRGLSYTVISNYSTNTMGLSTCHRIYFPAHSMRRTIGSSALQRPLLNLSWLFFRCLPTVLLGRMVSTEHSIKQRGRLYLMTSWKQ